MDTLESSIQLKHIGGVLDTVGINYGDMITMGNGRALVQNGEPIEDVIADYLFAIRKTFKELLASCYDEVKLNTFVNSFTMGNYHRDTWLSIRHQKLPFSVASLFSDGVINKKTAHRLTGLCIDRTTNAEFDDALLELFGEKAYALLEKARQ